MSTPPPLPAAAAPDRAALETPADPSAAADRLRRFELVFLLVVATEYWARALPKWNDLGGFYLGALATATAACVLAGSRPARRPGFALLAATQAAVVWQEFPATGNHAYLELAFCLLALLLDPFAPPPAGAADARLYLRAVRWMVCVVFFYGGVQKLVHGYWWQGQYLAYSLANESFRDLLRFLLPAGEVARLAALTGRVGDGPYLLTTPLARLVSIGVCVAEIALAPLLAWQRTRPVALVAALLFLLAIEIPAREVFFGLVFANAVLLFARTDLHRRFVPAVALLLALLLLVRLGVLPEVVFY